MATFPVIENDPRRFPMPTLEQGSPFGGVLSNAIAKRLAMAKAESAEKEVPYAGLSKLAEVLSKSAYANAVMPQIANKAASNTNVWAQLTDEQKRALASGSVSPVTGQSGTLSPLISKAMEIYQQQNQPKPSLLQGLKNLFIGNDQQQQQQQQQQQPQSVGLPQTQQPLSSQTQQSVPSQQSSGALPLTAQSAQSTPQSVNPQSQSTSETMTPDQKIQEYEKIIASGKASGTEHGKQLAEYGEQMATVTQQKSTEQYLSSLFQSPYAEKMLTNPYLNRQTLSYYNQLSNDPKAQKFVGELATGLRTFVTSSLNLFPRVTNQDRQFIESLKPEESDSLNTMKGKWIALTTFTNARANQIDIAFNMMKNGYDKEQAERAAQEVNMNAVRNQADAEAFPPPVMVETPSKRRVKMPKYSAQSLIQEQPGYKILEAGTY